MGAGDVDPAAGRLRRAERRDLDRRVRDDLQERLVVPDVVLARGDVEIADEDRPLGARVREPAAQLVHEIELVAELRIGARIGQVAAGGHVEIVDHHARWQAGGDVARVAAAAEVAGARVLERHAAEDHHAVVALLAARDGMGEAERGEDIERQLLDRGFRLLQAEHVGRVLAQEAGDGLGAQPDRVDVPGGDAERHGILAASDRTPLARGRGKRKPGPWPG
jgi:hypothetical protein